MSFTAYLVSMHILVSFRDIESVIVCFWLSAIFALQGSWNDKLFLAYYYGCRLAYKAFSDQKRRFFPHLDDELNGQTSGPVSKRHRTSISNHDDDANDYKTLSDVLAHLEKEVSGVKVFSYERLDWLKRASTLPANTNENPMEVSKDQSFHTLNRLRTSSARPTASDKVAIIELFCPSIFRAVVSLHPAGSSDPDAVAFFSPDEVPSLACLFQSNNLFGFSRVGSNVGLFFTSLSLDTSAFYWKKILIPTSTGR